MKPQVVDFITSENGKKNELPIVKVVEKKDKRSKIQIDVDKSGEVCLKTPKTKPINE